MPLTKDDLINIGSRFSWDEQVKKMPLTDTLDAILSAIAFIRTEKDQHSRTVTDLFCCISACCHSILTHYSAIADQNKGINWKKLATFKRDVMFERVTSQHRSRPGKYTKSNIDHICIPLVMRALNDIIRLDLPELELALQNIKNNPAHRQTQLICNNINLIIEYCYDELLLRVMSTTLVEMIQALPVTPQNISAFLYQLLCLGEAFNQLSLYNFFQFPAEIAHTLIHIRNFLCHTERHYYRLVITRLLQGQMNNSVIDIPKICGQLPTVLTHCAKLLKHYKEDGDSVTSIDHPNITQIWNRILRYSYPILNSLENEINNALYTCDITTIFNFLEKYESTYLSLTFDTASSMSHHLGDDVLRLAECYPVIELKYQTIVQAYSLTPEIIQASTQGFRQAHESIKKIRERQTTKLSRIARKLEKYESHFLVAQYQTKFFHDYHPSKEDWELHEENVEHDYATLQNKEYSHMKIQADCDDLQTKLLKKQCLELLEPLIDYFNYIIQNPDAPSTKLYYILAGSNARALLEGDRYSQASANLVFITDLQYCPRIVIDFITHCSMLEGMEDLIQGMRGYLSHLKQATIGERKFFDLCRWPYRESDASLQFIIKSISHLTRIRDSYRQAVLTIDHDTRALSTHR